MLGLAAGLQAIKIPAVGRVVGVAARVRAAAVAST